MAGFAAPAVAQLRGEVTRGNLEPMPIAIPPFVGAAGSVDELSQNVKAALSGPIDALYPQLARAES